MERVGFVGTGIMGAPMARNAMKAGFSVTVTNRTSSRAAPLAKDGATVVKTPHEVAERSEIVVTMVPNTPDVEAAVFGPDGVAAGARLRRVAGYRSRKDASGHRRRRGLVVGDAQLRAEDARRRFPAGLHDRPPAEGSAHRSRQRVRRPHFGPRCRARARALQRPAARRRRTRGEPRAHQGDRTALGDRGPRTVLAFDRALARLARITDLDAPWQWLATARADARYALYSALGEEQEAATTAPASATESARILELAQIAFGRLRGMLADVDDELLH